VKRLAFLVLTVIICIAFFLPWVKVRSEAVGGFTKILTGKKQMEVASISGFQVPVLANGKDSASSRMVLAARIGYGLWVTLVGYLGMGLVSFGRAFEKSGRKRT